MQKLIRFEVKNFYSYPELSVDLSDFSGLTLLRGDTGSGKSTFCDALSWILYGKTSKNGAVDEIKSWGTSKDTSGEAIYAGFSICRTRGKSNDLFIEENGARTRGKDLNDTQRLINDRLGMDFDVYLAATHYYEFSSLSQFFTLNSKSRKQTIEHLIDMSEVNTVGTKLHDYKKQVVTEFTNNINYLETNKAVLNKTKDDYRKYVEEEKKFKELKKRELDRLSKLDTNFESDKYSHLADIDKTYTDDKNNIDNQLSSLEQDPQFELEYGIKKEELKKAILEADTNKCKECNAPLEHGKKLSLVSDLNRLESKYTQYQYKQVQRARLLNSIELLKDRYIKNVNLEDTRVNSYKKQYEIEATKTNPYKDLILSSTGMIKQLDSCIVQTMSKISELSILKADCELLQDVLSLYRQNISRDLIKNLQHETNTFIAKYFDSEIQVIFDIKELDKIDVQITKNGNPASYTQLSKGQRCILRLCFGISAMLTLSEINGIDTQILFFDEALDGLSSDFKLKSMKLFEFLATKRLVFLAEHSSELVAMINNILTIRSISGESIIETKI